MASERTCTACGETKPLTDFSPHPKGRDGVRSRCKTCLSRQATMWRDRNRGQALDSHLRRTFGITLQQYEDLLAAQDGRCAICQSLPAGVPEMNRKQGIATRLVVDHCHDTGAVRGLLCAPCNKGVGHLRDDPNILRAAVSYLEAGPRLQPRAPEQLTNSWYKRGAPEPECGHPDRPHKSRRMCASCYRTWRLSRSDRRSPECGHPDRPHQARGMCGSCYNAARKREKRARAGP